MCRYVYINTCTGTCTDLQVRVHQYMYLYMYISTCTCTCKLVHVPVHVPLHVHQYMYWCTCTCVEHENLHDQEKTGYLDVEMKKYCFKIYRYGKINGHHFEKCTAMIKSTGKDFKKIIATIKSMDVILKNVTLR